MECMLLSGDCILKLIVMKLLVALVAVAIKASTLTVSGMMLHISFKCEYSVLIFHPYQKYISNVQFHLFHELTIFYAICLINYEAN